MTACHWFLVDGPDEVGAGRRVSLGLCYHRGVFSRAGTDRGMGGKVAPQRTERYHRAQMMSINFVPGHARPKAGWAVVYIRCGVAGMGLVLGRSGLVLAWSVLSFSALSWSLLSKLKI